MFNKNFYPTPDNLITKMTGLIRGNPKTILEPSAGKGDIIDALKDKWALYRNDSDISAIEIDAELQATLRGKRIKLIDTDFLEYSGPDKFDLIIANPPFSEGDRHLLKAIDIMYRGQIIFLLNAETIRNPYTNIRKELVRKLSELDAEIEFIQGAFKDAERPTGVEVALINIVIERNIEDDLFTGADDVAQDIDPRIEVNHELTTGSKLDELVAEYNQIVKIGIETIIGYYHNYRKIWKYIGLNREPSKYCSQEKDLTATVQNDINDMLRAVREDFWRRTLDLPEVRSRLTSAKRDEFEHAIRERSRMDFTGNNIRSFIINLIGSYEKTIMDSVLNVFDMFTSRHCFNGGLHEKNIHYFNGWKTNKAFKVGRKVIIPIYGSYAGPFWDFDRWKLNYKAAETLNDIDLVMNYFDGMAHYQSMSNTIEAAFSQGRNSKIRSTYFTVTCHKKGTIHLTFNDMNILRRFNVAACMGKEWLPGDYGAKSYAELTCEEKATAESFEGQKSYDKNLNLPLFDGSNLLRLAA